MPRSKILLVGIYEHKYGEIQLLARLFLHPRQRFSRRVIDELTEGIRAVIPAHDQFRIADLHPGEAKIVVIH